MYATFNRFEIKLTLKQAQAGSHQGQCDDDIYFLRKLPSISAQLNGLDPGKVKDELREYGAWEDSELSDHDSNLDRILWLACGNIAEDEKLSPSSAA